MINSSGMSDILTGWMQLQEPGLPERQRDRAVKVIERWERLYEIEQSEMRQREHNLLRTSTQPLCKRVRVIEASIHCQRVTMASLFRSIIQGYTSPAEEFERELKATQFGPVYADHQIDGLRNVFTYELSGVRFIFGAYELSFCEVGGHLMVCDFVWRRP